MSNPKLFISYHPSGPDHDEFVVRTAADLRDSGIDVCLDIWELPAGQDPAKFIEKMVSDPDIKVAIISDKAYAEMADSAVGGTAVVSRTMYEEHPREKFALVITERDEDGKPYVPDYYRPGVFIDMSAPDIISDDFDRLVRWAYGKPLCQKPPLGPQPDLKVTDIALGAGAGCRMAIDAIKHHRSNAAGRIDDYLKTFEENLERFRITDFEINIENTVYDQIIAFKPFRDEYIRFLFAVAGYRPDTEFAARIHRFFERLISYTRPPDHLNRHSDSDIDNFMFIVHELFLYTIAVFLKYEMFKEVNYLLSEKYYLAGKAELGQEEFVTFDNIHQHIESLEQLNKKSGMGLEAIRADMIRKRSAGTGLDLRDLMQADFTIFLRAEIDAQPYYSQWWPETLMFLGNFRGAFEIFARARSHAFFDRVKVVLGIEKPADLVKLIDTYEEEMRQLPRGLTKLSPSNLLGFEFLASQP